MSEKPTYEELVKRLQDFENLESEDRRSEDALRERETRFRTSADASPTAISIIRDDMAFHGVGAEMKD